MVLYVVSMILLSQIYYSLHDDIFLHHIYAHIHTHAHEPHSMQLLGLDDSRSNSILEITNQCIDGYLKNQFKKIPTCPLVSRAPDSFGKESGNFSRVSVCRKNAI